MSNLNLGLLKNKVGAPADLDAGGVEIASSAGPGWAWHNAHILCGAILLLCLFELILDSIQRNTVHLLRVSAAALKPLVSLWMKRTISLKPLSQRPVKLTLCVFLWIRGLWEWNRRVVEPQSFKHWYFLPEDHNASIVHWDENIHKNVTSVNHQWVIVEMLFCLFWSSIAVHGNSLSSRFIWNIRCE